MKNSIRSYNRSSSYSSNRSSKARGRVVTQVAAVVSRSSDVGGRVVTQVSGFFVSLFLFFYVFVLERALGLR